MRTTTRTLGTGAATAALVAAGLISPGTAHAAGPTVTVTPAHPVAGSSFTVDATGLTASTAYELRLTGTSNSDTSDLAEANSCSTATTPAGATTLSCTITEKTAGAYDLKLFQAGVNVANTGVTVNSTVEVPAAAQPKVTDRPGVDNDSVTITKVDNVDWTVAGNAVTFPDKQTSVDVPLRTATGQSNDYTVVATAKAGTSFPDGSSTWTKTYRLSTGAAVPTALTAPATPTKNDAVGTADDTITLTKNADYTWLIGGTAVTFAPGETSKTLKVTPTAGKLTVSAKANDGTYFAGNQPSVDFVLTYTDEKAEPESQRVSGADRVSTALEISKKFFPGPTDEVYVANAVKFPDALAAGPAAARAKSPLLLSMPWGAGKAVTDEVSRLKPKVIKVVGGPDVVSPAVVAELEKVAPVTRIEGASRFATAAAVADQWGASPTTYVAFGLNFPDALSAGSAAAKEGAPLLLSDGNSLSPETIATLKKMNSAKVKLVGGSDVLRANVERQIKDVLPNAAVTRLAGADRFATSAAVVDAVTGTASGATGTTTAFLATGLNYPDALAGVPAAAAANAPLVLTRPTCLPASVATSLGKLTKLGTVVRLGSSNVVGDFPLKAVCS